MFSLSMQYNNDAERNYLPEVGPDRLDSVDEQQEYIHYKQMMRAEEHGVRIQLVLQEASF
jgi:hypothetical protein